MLKLIIEKATIEDAPVLTDITKRSKAYWGYSSETMLIWADLLFISGDYIEDKFVFKLVVDKKIVGYYSYLNIDHSTMKLDNLFILPEYIAQGYGRILMLDVIKKVKESQATKLVLDSDPHTEKFYHKFGFVTVGKKETLIKDRFLPIMELKLEKS